MSAKDPQPEPVDAPSDPDAPPVPTDRRPPGPDDRPIDLPPPPPAPDAAEGEPAADGEGTEAATASDGPSAAGEVVQPEPEPSTAAEMEVDRAAHDRELVDGSTGGEATATELEDAGTGAGAETGAVAGTEVVAAEPDDSTAGHEADAPAEALQEETPAVDAEADAAAAAKQLRSGAAARRKLVRVAVVAVLVAVGAAVVAVIKTQQAGDLASQRDDRREIEDVAGHFGAAYLSYDYAHPEGAARAVGALATKAFSSAYAAQRAPGIRELFSSRQTTTIAATKEVFVGALHGRSARALVVVDVVAKSPTDGEQRLHDVAFVLDLDRTGRGWRVGKVARAPQPGLDAPASTTTTAAPPPG